MGDAVVYKVEKIFSCMMVSNVHKSQEVFCGSGKVLENCVRNWLSMEVVVNDRNATSAILLSSPGKWYGASGDAWHMVVQMANALSK